MLGVTQHDDGTDFGLGWKPAESLGRRRYGHFKFRGRLY